jgi:hypothetical protein
LGESAITEQLSDVQLGFVGELVDRPFELMAALGETNDSRSAVGGIWLAREVAALFEVGEQFVNGLLGDLKLVGDLGRASPVECGIAEHRNVGSRDVVVSGGCDAGVVSLPHPLPRHAHEGPDVRTARCVVVWR